MKLLIFGTGILAKAIRDNCEAHDLVKEWKDKPEIGWVAHQTETSPTGEPDQHGIMHRIIHDLRGAPKGMLVLISSQIRVGTTKALEQMRPDLHLVHVPENVRLKTAKEDFAKQSRIVIGRRRPDHDKTLTDLLSPFSPKLIWTNPETAECVKHVLNGFLALQVAFANEYGRLVKAVGADPLVVADALKSDSRVSPDAPLVPGEPYSPAHLGREVHNLNWLANEHKLTLPVIQAIAPSNAQ